MINLIGASDHRNLEHSSEDTSKVFVRSPKGFEACIVIVEFRDHQGNIWILSAKVCRNLTTARRYVIKTTHPALFDNFVYGGKRKYES